MADAGTAGSAHAVPPRGRRTRPQGSEILENFLYRGLRRSRPTGRWRLRRPGGRRHPRAGGRRTRVICALSGGVDSAVAAALVHRAIGDQLTASSSTTGCCGKGEARGRAADLPATASGCELALRRRRRALPGPRCAASTDPEEKRKIIGAEFIAVFEEEARRARDDRLPGPGHPLSGRDRVARRSSGPSATIKTHHNVGGLPEGPAASAGRAAARPLQGRGARARRRSSGCPTEIVWRQPFPGPGLAVRILGEVTEERLEVLRERRRHRHGGDRAGRARTASSGRPSPCSCPCERSA